MTRYRRAWHLLSPHAHRTFAATLVGPGGASDRIVLTPTLFPEAIVETLTLDGADSGVVARDSLDATESSATGTVGAETPLTQRLLTTRFTGQADGKWNHDLATGWPARVPLSAPTYLPSARLRAIEGGAGLGFAFLTVTTRPRLLADGFLVPPGAGPAPAPTPPSPPAPPAPPTAPPPPVGPPHPPRGPRPPVFRPPNPWESRTAFGRRGPTRVV